MGFFKNPALLKKVRPPTKRGGIARGSIDQLCVERRKFPVFRRKGERDSGALGIAALSTVRTCSNFKDPKFGHISAILGRVFLTGYVHTYTRYSKKSSFWRQPPVDYISALSLRRNKMCTVLYIQQRCAKPKCPIRRFAGGQKGRKSLVSAEPSSKKM